MRFVKLAALLCILSASSAFAASYNPVVDFTPNSNTAGAVWNYASAPTPTGALTLLPVHQSGPTSAVWMFADPASVPYPQYDPNIAKNTTASLVDDGTGTVYPTDMLSLHPGGPDGPFGAPVNDSILLFRAPSSGSYTFSGLFQGLAGGGSNPGAANPTSSDVHIIDPLGASLLDSPLNGFGTTVPFGFTKSLLAGDTIRFVVGLGSNNSINSDTTGLKLLVTTVPEPASLMMLGLGGMLLLRRRQK